MPDPSLPTVRPVIAILVLAFVLSGVAGLIYESIWSRYLSLFVGHDAYAQIIVLVIFLGGMSAGAMLIGRYSERIRDPLRTYALIEALVGVLGLAFHPLYVALTGLAYDAWFPALAGTPWLQPVKWSLAGALILPQSVLLGATFPLMSAAVIRRAPQSPGAMLGLLYFANSFGAAAGVLLSGFFLIGLAGLPGTVTAAATLNLAVAAMVLLALGAERRRGVLVAPPAVPPQHRKPPAGRERGDRGLSTLLLVVGFGTGLASFIYEIAWIRMLSLVLGSAAHSFEVMLSAFILGLALGALWVRRRADRFRSPLQALGMLQWAMGSLALATIPIYLASFHWMSDLVSAVGRTEQGYRLFTLARYGICLAVMLPATFCAGTTLPLITRSLMGSGSGERAIGLVYGVNTLGSILGAALAGLALLPLLGLKGLLVAGALLDIGLGIAILAYRRGAAEPLARVAVASTAVLLAATLAFARFDPMLLTSGVYRFGTLPDPDSTRIVSYRHGRTASISVEHYLAAQNLTLSSNGKADATLRLLWLESENRRTPTVFRGDEGTQILLGVLSLAHAPRARTAAVIGHGSGMTSHVLLGSPHLEQLTTIEIEPEVIRAARAFLPANRRVYEDPRSRFAVDDAKSYFAAAQKRYDLVISEPSHPWVSGVAGLFSTEFHARVKRHLTEDGVFGQWLHLYELDDDLVLGVVAAIHRNFSDYELFLVDDFDMLIVATNRASGLAPDWAVVDYPGIAADLRHLPPFTPGLFEAMRVGGRAALGPLMAATAPNSDFFPRLDLGAERARFLGRQALGFMNLHAGRFSPTMLGNGHPVAPIGWGPVPTPEIPRHRDLLMSTALRFSPPGVDLTRIDARLPQALERKRRMQAAFRSGQPPSDWRAWAFEALHAEHEWHLGTAGVVDENFYRLLRDYLSRANAPHQARQAVEFIHDLAVWDLAAAAARADSLLAWSRTGMDWIPPEVLLDGAVTAKLRSGDRAGARAALTSLLPRAGRPANDLRTRVVAAFFDRISSGKAGSEKDSTSSSKSPMENGAQRVSGS